MKRELGIARCGLACCLCSENITCNGCSSDECVDKEWCENRKCSIEKEISNCFLCENDCHKGILSKMKHTDLQNLRKDMDLKNCWIVLKETKKME